MLIPQELQLSQDLLATFMSVAGIETVCFILFDCLAF